MLEIRLKSNIYKFIICLVIILVLAHPGLVFAQEDRPPGPVYIVQEGDSLWGIAQKFNVSPTELTRYNGIRDPGQLAIGAQLVIPGMEDIQGVLITKPVPFGENLRSLSRRYGISVESLAQLNRIASPTSLFIGANIILPEENVEQTPMGRSSLSPGESMLELAVRQNINPWRMVIVNSLQSTWDTMPGDSLLNPAKPASDSPGGLPAAISEIEVEPVPLAQGTTTVIRMEVDGEMDLFGKLLGREFQFFRDTDGAYIGIQGVHAMTRPGFYPLVLSGKLVDGTPVNYSQWIYVRDGNFSYERLEVPPETINPDITKPEDELWASLIDNVTPEKLWQDNFVLPVSPLFADCYTSLYGNRRSYNGSPFNYFHTGLDFCGGLGQDIYAAGAGVVVFADDLTVRGQSTVIDHGWGLYTAYIHQSEILVDVGEQVEAGQLIGLVGATGRVTGPHLHFEVIVNGVQVNPLNWLERAYP